jgi:hypothetical protein
LFLTSSTLASGSELDVKINNFLLTISSDLNSKCPMNVDRFIILKNTMVDGKIFIYRYFTDFQAMNQYALETYGKKTTTADWEEGFKKIVIKEDCSDPDNPFFAVGASIGRYYYDENNTLRIKIETSRKDCPKITDNPWAVGMYALLPKLVCQDNQIYRQCYAVSQNECETAMKSATADCLQKHLSELPPDISTNKKVGSHWGQIVGACASEKYSSSLKSKFTNTNECNNMNNWK